MLERTKKLAIVAGALGQDGQYLCRHLESLNYEVILAAHNIESETKDKKNVDISSFDDVANLIKKYKPDEFYNLAAVSSSELLNRDRIRSTKINAFGVLNILESIQNFSGRTRFFQALSSEIFAGVKDSPQTEYSIPKVLNIYGLNKLYAWELLKIYRNNFNIFCCGGILYNHESPLRQLNFLSRKITNGVARIYYGLDKNLVLGNRHARRDWGHAQDFAAGMHLMLQCDVADDYILSTGITHSVEDFCRLAFNMVGLDYKKYVIFSNDDGRRIENIELCGDNSKAKRELNWEPKISFNELVFELISYDLNLIRIQIDN